jgi:hypothetical protein
VIQKRLIDRLALELLDGTIKPGDRVHVTAENGELALTASTGEAVTAASG